MNTSSAVTKYLDKYRSPDEQVVLWVHRHPSILIAHAIPAVIAFLAVSLWGFQGGPGVPGTVLWLLFVVGLLWLAWKWIEWSVNWIVITNKRIFAVYGPIFRKVAMMPLSKVTDLGYRQSPLGRLLGYGAVHLETAGQTQDLRDIKHLPDPEEFYRTLTQLMLR